MIQAVRAILFVEVDDRLAVAPGAEFVAAGFELRTQLEVIVNFAVKNQPKSFIFVGEGLLPGFQIDDAEPPHGQANISGDVKARAVRAAMNQLLVHCVQNGRIDLRPGIELNDATNSAHG